MRRLTLQNRMKRCRSSTGTGQNIFGGAAIRQHELCPSPEAVYVTFEPNISGRLRAYVLDHGDLFCSMCGIAPGDIDDLTGHRATFDVHLIADAERGGKDELSNLRFLCSTCNQGAKNITTEKPSTIWLLSQVRRAGQDEQRAVLEWLLKKFKN
jgi:hypothetical protein